MESGPIPEPESRPSRVLTTREWAALWMSLFGTVALFVLAGACHDFTIFRDEQGASFMHFPAGCALRLAIAIAFFLINLGNTLLILVFEPLGERRYAEIFAKLTLYGTPAAIVISAFIGPA